MKQVPTIAGKGAAPGLKTQGSRLKASIQTAIAIGIAWVLFKIAPYPLAGWIGVGIAGGFFLGIFMPSWHNQLERLAKSLAWMVGRTLTWILLVPVYYVFFSLGRVVFWLSGKDVLERRWAKARATYWEACRPMESLDSYQRQF